MQMQNENVEALSGWNCKLNCRCVCRWKRCITPAAMKKCIMLLDRYRMVKEISDEWICDDRIGVVFSFGFG